MYTWTKRGTMIVLAVTVLFMSIVVPLKKAEASMMYNNLSYANIEGSVNSDGRLQVVLSANGIKGVTTRIKAELYVEKRILGIFWSRVDIGYTNNVWEDSTTDVVYSNTFSTNLNSTGTYRVTVTFTAYGSGGQNDVVVKTLQLVY